MDRLFEGIELLDLRGEPAVEVSSIVFDSRQATNGSLFCCIVGHHADGHDHAGAALARGAAALLVERPLDLAVPQALVAAGRVRTTMAQLACRLEGYPADALTTVAVTGTNGKTTVTHLLRSVLDAAGGSTEVVGTLDGARTTPEAPELQRRFAAARDAGRTAVAVEVSSHALVQARVDGFRFSAAIFTNLSHDHLDFHGTMDAYFEAKATLFTPEHARIAVVNTGDPWGRRLAARTALPVVAYTAADASDLVTEPHATSFTWRGRRVRLSVPGAHNVINALAAAAAATALGVREDAVVTGLAAATAVRGRFDVVDTGGPFTAVVDYAHTPDGLAVCLDSARRLASDARVIVVFGCGGDRDSAKRPAMGAVAAAGADEVVVTSDNPRNEDPDRIISDVLDGIADQAHVVVEPDRAAAIAIAVDMASPGDVVVVAGKGHETTMEAGGQVRAFDDRVEIAAAARRRDARQRSGAG